jgi:DNA mismatch repair protein MutL
MPETLASQVAAGEVIERPASVVKELVENSLDAGASAVEVEIQRGGVAMIRVSDDGCGMGRDDAMLAFERHATSKLHSADELLAVRTLGFRGEALPSIASVARLELATRERDAVAGTEIVVDCGAMRHVRDSGCAPGTRVEVRQLFVNVPARRKFLRTEATEAAHVEHQVRLHALAAPGVRFRYRQDGRDVFDLPPVEDWRVRIGGLHGTAAARGLLGVSGGDGRTFSFSGFILPAGSARRGRRHQFFFLNGRPIEDAAVSRGLREGFGGGLASGQNPAAWLWIEMDPAWVDVNVHPAKREVRFRRADLLGARIAEAVAAALRPPKPPETGGAASVDAPDCQAGEAAAPSSSGPPGTGGGEGTPETQAPFGSPASSPFGPTATQGALSELGGGPEAGTASPGGPPRFRILGELGDRFVAMASADGLVLLDPRAARERIVYEQLRRDQRVEAQRLLMPALVELDPREADVVERNLEGLAEAGVEIAPFGGRTFQVTAVPVFLSGGDPQSFLHELIERLIEGAGGAIRHAAGDQLARALARQAGIGEPARADRAESLLAELFDCELPYCAADGRPTLLELSLSELERKFQV